MPENLLITLDEDDLKCLGQIIKNVKEVSTPQGAIKWALKQYAKQTEPVSLDVTKGEITFLSKSYTASEPVTSDPIPLGQHTFQLPELPLGKHNLSRIKLKQLSDLDYMVIIGPDTLGGLRRK